MKNPIRLSVTEAAKFFGVSAVTIRRAISERKIPYVVVRGRYKILFDGLLKWSQESARTARSRDEKGIGQYVRNWKIKNTLYSPNPKLVDTHEEPESTREPKSEVPPRPERRSIFNPPPREPMTDDGVLDGSNDH